MYPDPALPGSWPTVFSKAINELNRLQFGVTLIRSGVPPGTRYLTGANVYFGAGDPTLTVDCLWGPQTITLDAAGHAKTRSIPTDAWQSS